MLISDLVQAARVTVSTLDDPDVSDEVVVNNLRQSMRILSAWTGIQFTVTGSTWDTWAITSPTVINDSLVAIISLQLRYLIHTNSIVIRTKVGPILVEYDPKAADREKAFLWDLIQAYADQNGILLPTGFSVMSGNEYDVLLNPSYPLEVLARYNYGYGLGPGYFF